MSIRLRVRYQFRSFFHYVFAFSVPEFLTGTFAKVTVTTLAFLLMIGYVVQISELTTGGYEIATLEKSITALKDENKTLNTELAASQSMTSIKKRLNEISMVRAEQIKYVRVQDNVVAQR